MSQALFTSMGGINCAQQNISVISNNVANLNTTGYKSSDMRFATLFSNTVTTGNVPSTTSGGTNPRQIGMGVQVASIKRDFTNGQFNSTGLSSDAMISGKGFFTVMDPAGNVYLTRDGNFTLDADGNLTNSVGYKVVGANSLYSETGSEVSVKIPQEFTRELEGNNDLSSKFVNDMNTGTFTEGTMEFDYNGATYSIVIGATAPPADVALTSTTDVGTFMNDIVTAINTEVGAAVLTCTIPTTGDDIGKIVLTNATANALTFTEDSTSNMASALQIGAIAGSSSATSKVMDWVVDVNPAAAVTNTTTLKTWSIGETGAITATYSNGDKLESYLQQPENVFKFKYVTALGVEITGDNVSVNPRVADPESLNLQLATVTNEAGLTSMANNLWQPGPNSGDIRFTIGNQMGLGSIISGGLESSNVDLSKELANMIIAQRAVQANSRVFSTASSVLQELTSLGR